MQKIHNKWIDNPLIGDDGKFHFLYKIINRINGKYYIGVHSTKKLNDNYHGSGKAISRAITKYGIDNFEMEILQMYKTTKEMYKAEEEYVTTDIVNDSMCYNMKPGGVMGNIGYVVYVDIETNECVYTTPDDERVLSGKLTVKDSNGNTCSIEKDDYRYLSGELVPYFKGKITVKNKNGEFFSVDADDPRYLSGELVPTLTGKVLIQDKDGKRFAVDKNDEKYLSGEYKSVNSGKLLAVDDDGNAYSINKDDPRYISGELKPYHTNKVVVTDSEGNVFVVDKNDPRYISGELQNRKTNRVFVTDSNGNIHNVEKSDPRYISGELRIASAGKTTVIDKNGKIFQVDVNDPRFLNGELISIHKDMKYIYKIIDNKYVCRKVHKNNLQKYINDGWIAGQKPHLYKSIKMFRFNIDTLTFETLQEKILKADYDTFINSHIKNGWYIYESKKEIPRIINNRIFMWNLSNKMQRINIIDVPEYIKIGWTFKKRATDL